MNTKHLVAGLVVSGCLAALAGASLSGEADFTSPACSTGEDAKPPAKPQPGATTEKEYYKKLDGRLDTSSLNADCETKITASYNASWHGHWIDMGVGEPGIATSMQDN